MDEAPTGSDRWPSHSTQTLPRLRPDPDDILAPSAYKLLGYYDRARSEAEQDGDHNAMEQLRLQGPMLTPVSRKTYGSSGKLLVKRTA